jgi:hypothetical protein
MVAGSGIAVVAVALGLLHYLPFQDLPNHELVLKIGRALRAGETSRFYELPRATILGYTLHARLDQLLAPLLSTEASVHLQAILAAAGLPLAVGWLARRAGAPAGWAALLALPLMLSWPLRLGLLAYALGQPLVFVAAAEAVHAARTGSRLALVGLALALLGCWMAHPLALASAAVMVALAWLTFGTPRLDRLALLAAAALPAALVAARDLALDGLAAPAGVRLAAAAKLDAKPRGLLEAVAELLTCSITIRRPEELWWHLPYAAALVALCAVGLARPPSLPSRAAPYVVLAAASALVIALVVPSDLATAQLVGERLAVIAVGALALAGACACATAPRALQAAVAAAVALSLAQSVAAVSAEAGLVAAIAGDRAPHSLEGMRLTARIECRPLAHKPWALWDPLYHAWAYAIHPTRGFVPYVFAERRYRPAWIVPWPGKPRSTSEVLFDLALAPERCEAEARMRARLVTLRQADEAYESPVFYGPPEELARLRDVSLTPIAPGMAVSSPAAR